MHATLLQSSMLHTGEYPTLGDGTSPTQTPTSEWLRLAGPSSVFHGSSYSSALTTTDRTFEKMSDNSVCDIVKINSGLACEKSGILHVEDDYSG